jgi:hypothetical protein
MSSKRLHTLYLQSKWRESGTPWQYTISLPEVIQSDVNLERFKISLQSFCVYNNWYLVKEGTNTITIDSVEYVIPSGTYSYQRLARAISTITGAAVNWLTDSNKMNISFNSSKIVSFDAMGTLLGFEPNTPYVGASLTFTKCYETLRYDTPHDPPQQHCPNGRPLVFFQSYRESKSC